jgi:hypothetical protein
MTRLSNRVRAHLLDLVVGRCCLDRLDGVLHFDNDLSERMKQIECPMIAIFSNTCIFVPDLGPWGHTNVFLIIFGIEIRRNRNVSP